MDEIATSIEMAAGLYDTFAEAQAETECGSNPLRPTQNGYRSSTLRCGF